jgi:hypothetical protein
MRPLCKTCGKRPVAINYHKGDRVFYRKTCDHCARHREVGRPKWQQAGYKKKDKCDRCGYTSKYTEQFDVYYIDGEPSNTKLANLKTVCSNCQRILHIFKLPWKRGDLTPDF